MHEEAVALALQVFCLRLTKLLIFYAEEGRTSG
jgi:hypothetical protein